MVEFPAFIQSFFRKKLFCHLIAQGIVVLLWKINFTLRGDTVLLRHHSFNSVKACSTWMPGRRPEVHSAPLKRDPDSPS